MNDLISRQAAIDAAMEELDGGTPYDIPNKIMALPSASKSGHWSFVGDNMFECANCKVAYTTAQLNALRNYDKDPYMPNFCPNCGADMRGEQND